MHLLPWYKTWCWLRCRDRRQKLVVPQSCADINFQHNFTLPISTPVLGLSLTSPKVNLRPACTDMILRPRFVAPTSPPDLEIGLISSITQSKQTNLVLPSTCLNVALPKALPSISATLDLDLICPAPQSKRSEPIPPSTASDVVLPAGAPSSPSPPIDLTLSELASTIKTDPKFRRSKQRWRYKPRFARRANPGSARW